MKIIPALNNQFNSNNYIQPLKTTSLPIYNNPEKLTGCLDLLALNNKNYQLSFKGNINDEIENLRNAFDIMIKKSEEEFYSSYKTIKQIEEFECAKTILEIVKSNDPRDCSLREKEYKNILSLALEEKLGNTFNLDRIFENQEELLEELREIVEDTIKKGEIAKIKYQAQNAITNPNLNEIKNEIKPRIIDFKKPNYVYDEHLSEDIKQVFVSSKNLTLNSGSLMEKEYDENTNYDLPLKFAAASYNTLNEKGNAYICNNIPDVFEGIDKKELLEMLDIISMYTRAKKSYDGFIDGIKLNFNIQDKKLTFEAIGCGFESCCFRIKREGKKPVIFKTYTINNDHPSFSTNGFWGNISILREANFDNVEDVPKLYMANPIYKPIEYKGERFLGGWAIMEDAKTRTNTQKQDLKFKQWLDDKNLIYLDNNIGNIVNNIYIDTGSVISDKNKFFENKKTNDYVDYVFLNYLNGKTTQDIIESL